MNGRGVGVTDALASAVPEVLVPLLAACTFLGDTVLLVTVGPALYWFGPSRDWMSRRDGTRLLAATLGGLALVVAAKSLFALPRPEDSVMLVAEAGYGFPSGHTTGAAVFYGALAALTTVWSRRQRWLAAGGLVGVVGATRILLGVHYLVDVLAGVVAGGAFLAVVLALTRRRVTYGFALAFAVALCGLATAGVAVDATGAVGATAGALAGWLSVDHRGALKAHVHPVGGALAIGVVGGAAGLTLKFEPALPVVAATHAVAGATFVALPAIQDYWRNDALPA